MNIKTRLKIDRAVLRDRVAEIHAVLGPPAGIGLADQAAIDLRELEEAERRFGDALTAHEDLERGLWGESLDPDTHQDIEEVLKLLAAVTHVCDGRHLYQVRRVACRLADLLERHMRRLKRRSGTAPSAS